MPATGQASFPGGGKNRKNCPPPFLYDFKFGLVVEGNIQLLSKTRYYRSEDLHLKYTASPTPDGWRFKSMSMVSDATRGWNFGIGEGPRKHQRYILCSGPPSEKKQTIIEARIRELEGRRGCYIEEEIPGQGIAGMGGVKKEGFFNYYLWNNPRGSFNFLLSHKGGISAIENQTDLSVLEKRGGKLAKPRFFETLENALLAVPPFAGTRVRMQDLFHYRAQWQMGCRPILEGLVTFAENVYKRKMTLLEPEALQECKVSYTAQRIPRTPLLRIRGSFSDSRPTTIRVSGFKGKIWIQSMSRVVYLNMEDNRIVKDELEMSFGIDRKKKVLSISGTKNVVRLSLVDECFLSCPDSDEAILETYRTCCPVPKRPASK